MLALISSKDSYVNKKDISFIHLNSSNCVDIDIEAKPLALSFARKFNLKKVYLFYGKDGKIIYDFSL